MTNAQIEIRNNGWPRVSRKYAIGKQFGRLTVIDFDGPNVLVECSCGKHCTKSWGNVKAGRTVSCGCRLVETFNKSKGYSTSTPAYVSWENMNNRCNHNNAQSVGYYQNVAVCEQWKGGNGYKNFLQDMGARPLGTSLDRINNDGDYEPVNCRWATKKQQQNNLRTNRQVNFNGEKISSVAEYARKVGTTYMKAWHAINKAEAT